MVSVLEDQEGQKGKTLISQYFNIQCLWVFWKPDRTAASVRVQKSLEVNNLLLFDYWEKYYFFNNNEALKCSLKQYQVYAYTLLISKSCIYVPDGIQEKSKWEY